MMVAATSHLECKWIRLLLAFAKSVFPWQVGLICNFTLGGCMLHLQKLH